MDVIWTRAHSVASHTYNCTASTLSPSPTNVENITMESYCFSSNTRITLTFSWTPPSNFNGEPTNYTVCLGTRPLAPTEDINEKPEGHFCTSDSLLVSPLANFSSESMFWSNCYEVYKHGQAIKINMSIKMIQIFVKFVTCSYCILWFFAMY